MVHHLLHPIAPSQADLRDFLDRHNELLQLERDEEEEQTRLLNSNCSPKELERKGLSLGGLGVSNINVGLGGKTMIELHRPLAYHTNPIFPPHTFRTGDPARIETHVADSGKAKKKAKDKDEDEHAVEGIVYKVSKEKIVVAVDGSKDVDLPERVRLLKLANSVTFDRMERTLRHLRRLVVYDDPTSATDGPASASTAAGTGDQQPSTSSAASNRSMIDVLLGAATPTWSQSVPPTFAELQAGSSADTPRPRWYGEKLNDSQKEAINFCLRAEQVACIHGPPGTGKTHTLVELIFQLLSRPATPGSALPPRILVTTPSNLALDNILLRLHLLAQSPPYSELLPAGSILRLGHPTRVHRELISQTLDWRASNGEDGELVRDVGKEIEGHLSDLGKKRGERGAVKGKERGNKWGEVRELRKEYRQRETKVVRNVVNAARVVLATCHSAGSRQINNMEFDVCIIDEATQAVEAVCWVPILKSKKLILAGDPQQLPPTILSRGDKSKQQANQARPASDMSQSIATSDGRPAQDGRMEPSDVAEKLDAVSLRERPRLRPPRTLETTLFDRLERLYGEGIKRVLNTQYRMNETIASFPSAKLYDDKLISAPSVAKRTLLDLPSTADAADDEDIRSALEPTVVFYDTAGCEYYERNESDDEKGGKRLGEGSKSNANEAEIVVKWVEELVRAGVPPEEIAVVTPYQAQVALVSDLLAERYPAMTIGSVDGLQGQEREAIILTLVRSNAKSEVGFLGEYRRLNVAMTRARRQLCVVGDSDTVGKGSKYLASWMKWLEDNADVRYAGDMLES